jgi:hypothetical protein
VKGKAKRKAPEIVLRESGDPVHSVWAYNKQTQWAVLITVYRPDPDLWINWRERRK